MGGRPFGGPPTMRGRGMMRGGPPRGMGFRFVSIKLWGKCFEMRYNCC